MIWSTLEDTRKLMPADDKRMPMLQDKYRVPHFDAKAEANASSSPGLPATFLVTSFYWDNLYMFGLAPKKGDDGVVQLDVPDGQTRSWPASPPRTSASARTASSRPASSTSARPSASPAST